MNGKQKCNALRAMRRRIAEANDIPWDEKPCTHTGSCKGTCPYCEARTAQLSELLEAAGRAGRKVALVGLCAGMAVTATACSPDSLRLPLPELHTTGIMPMQATEEPMQPDGEIEACPTDEPMVLEGEVTPLSTVEPTIDPDEQIMGDIMYVEPEEP